MTEERLAELEKKWGQQFDGHEVIELIREVRRLATLLHERPVLLIPSDDPTCKVGDPIPVGEIKQSPAVTGDMAPIAEEHWKGMDALGELHPGGYSDCPTCHPDLDKSLPRT